MGEPIRFAKGHGTGNDFVILPDPDGTLELTDEQVRVLCNRRFGIGGDGILRVAPSATLPGGWFMDYRNADGSLAEMCGNGSRVFARYLVEQGLADGPVVEFETRAGVVRATIDDSGQDAWTVTVAIGTPQVPRLRAAPVVAVGERSWPATALILPNPHAVVWVDDLAEAGDLAQAPALAPRDMFPDGANVEFVIAREADDDGTPRVAMRVHERGSGETLSCGTGACAVGVAALRLTDSRPASWPEAQEAGAGPVPGRVRIEVPGGEVVVTERADGVVELTGPAVIVAHGEMDRSALDQPIPGRAL